MGALIGNHLGVKVGLVSEPDALIWRFVRLIALRPLASRHGCDMPVLWSNLSTADCHLVRMSSTTSFWICLLCSLSVSSAVFSPRYRSRSTASDLADAGRIGWKC